VEERERQKRESQSEGSGRQPGWAQADISVFEDRERRCWLRDRIACRNRKSNKMHSSWELQEEIQPSEIHFRCVTSRTVRK